MKEITNAELEVLKVIWESPKNTKEIAIKLNKNISTIKTLIYRLLKKGVIKCNKSDKINQYIPIIKKEIFLKNETEKFIKNIYDGDKEELLKYL